MLRWGFSILLVTIALAAPAEALPPDPLPVPLTPADGASLTVAPDGIPATFTCPVYRTYSAGDGFDVYGGPKDYGLSMATSPAVGADGRLTNPVALISGTTATGGDQCAAGLGAGGASPRPQETPGTYYWQVWRICTGCASGYEVSPIRSFTLHANAALAIKPPKTIYAGYPFILPVTATGVANFTPLAVRRSGGASVGAGTVTSESASPTVTLSSSTKLAAVVTIGNETVSSPEVAVKVLKAKAWKTKASDDGAYRGTRTSKFTVAKKGRELRSLSVSVAMLCPTPGMLGQFTTQVGVAKVNKIRLAPDGSFVGVARPEEETSIRVRGKIGKRKLSGGVAELSVGTCSGTAEFSAKKG